MDKRAVTEHPIHPLLAERWSPRAFEDREVSGDVLNSLLEAARWAPSCFNDQPWFFLVARRQDTEEFERMLSCLVEGNRSWAKNAQVLMITVSRTIFEHNGKPNRHWSHDLGLAAGGRDVGNAVKGVRGADNRLAVTRLLNRAINESLGIGKKKRNTLTAAQTEQAFAALDELGDQVRDQVTNAMGADDGQDA